MSDTFFWLFVGLFGLCFAALLIYAIALWYRNFTKELQFLNTEINRTRGREQHYWKSRKRRLFLSILPFVRYDG